MKNACIRVCKRNGQQAEDEFVLKVLQLADMLQFRHSVMLVGNAGSGKTTIWKTLAASLNDQRERVCSFDVINPKVGIFFHN